MSEKTLDRKSAKQIVIAERDNGKTNQEIYLQLKEQYSDLKGIANLIIGTVLKEDKAKFKTYNIILVALLILNVVFRVLFVVNFAAAPNMIKVILMAAAPLLGIIFAFQIFNYEASAYRSCGLFTIGLTLPQLMNYSSTTILVIDVTFVIAIVFFCFYLAEKLFPNYSNSLKTDSEGDYIL